MDEKATQQDWHSADIIAAIKKKEKSLAGLSRESGLSASTLANALARPWPKGEKIIADAIGLPPDVIWPSRYFRDGVRIDRPVRSRKKTVTN